MHAAGSSKVASTNDDQSQLDLIWNLRDRDVPLPGLVEDWLGISAVALQPQLALLHDPSAGPMPLSFVIFFTKDPRAYKIVCCLDLAAI